MTFGEYLKNSRTFAGLSMRELSERSGISAAEISRIESGERKKPSPFALKTFAPHLLVPYEELLRHAGYIEEVIDHQRFTENVYRDEKGHLIDITRRAKDMYENNSSWANLAYRVTASDLSESEVNIIKAQTKALLEQFIKNKNN